VTSNNSIHAGEWLFPDTEGPTARQSSRGKKLPNANNRLKDGGATKVKIRVASESDAPMLATLRYELRSSLDEVVEDEGKFMQRCTFWMRQRFRGHNAWRCWIAERQGRPVGNVWLQLIEKIPNPASEPEHYIYLTSFYVSEEYRGKGIGSMLLSAALAWAKTNDVHSVILTPTERSRPLYLRHGFSDAHDLMQLGITPIRRDPGFTKIKT
jgi:GNAT superfamily N-acetyltransferase